MATVITHFHNEAKMLPFWLQHHLKLFDHGILIDHYSTDNSVEICRSLAPHWTIIKSDMKDFNALDNDFEVMSYEATVSGWKMALNVSEFLHFPRFAQRLLEAEAREEMAIRSRGVIMVDLEAGKDLDPSIPLIQQKHYGFIENESCCVGRRRILSFTNGKQGPCAYRERIIHRYRTGAYTPGRHNSFHVINEMPRDVFTLWYGYSPWINWNIEKKLSFSAHISALDKKQGHGLQHLRSRQQLERDYDLNKMLSYDLLPILNGYSLPPSELSNFLRLRLALFKNQCGWK